jgi:methyl-accepting chemotaxis protein
MHDQNSKGVEHVVSELQMAVFGNPKVNFSGMMNELKEIRKIVDDMAHKMDELQNNGKERSDLITEIKQEVTELKHKVNQLDGTVRWRLHSAAIVLLSLFGSAFLVGEVIRLLALFF